MHVFCVFLLQFSRCVIIIIIITVRNFFDPEIVDKNIDPPVELLKMKEINNKSYSNYSGYCGEKSLIAF